MKRAIIFFLAVAAIYGCRCAFADTPARGIKMSPEVQRALQRMAKSYPTGDLARMMQQRRALRDAGTINRASALQFANSMKVPLVLGSYANTNNMYSAQDFQNLLFENNPTGTMINYYTEVSYGQMQLSGNSFGWFRTPQNQNFYVGNNAGLNGGGARFVLDLAMAADPTIDFSQFDSDGNGYVDVIMAVHTGPGGETQPDGQRDNIWSHRWSLNATRQFYPNIMPQGEYTTNDPWPGHPGEFIKINDFILQPEQAAAGNTEIIQIGVFCHEFGHALGLPDLYDTDESNGESAGLGVWCLMATGSYGGDLRHPEAPTHMSAWCKKNLGWVTPVKVTSNQINQSLPNVEQNAVGSIFKIWKNGNATSEYFLLENRQKMGYDKYLPEAGLMIWHIDHNIIDSQSKQNKVNADATHKGVDLEEADGLADLDQDNNRGDSGDPFPGRTSNRAFNFNSNPNSQDYLGNDTGVEISNISLAGQMVTADLKITPGSTPENVFTVYNDGATALNVTNISADKSWLSASPTSFSVPPSGQQLVQVTINWQQVTSQQNGTLSVMSNDPAKPVSTVQVTAVPKQSAASITVTAPATGENWTVGSTQVVSWSSNGVTGEVNIKLSTDGGVNFPFTLQANTPNDGTESIIVPNNPSTTCRVRVEAVSNPNIFGNNPGNFTIQVQQAAGSSIKPQVAASQTIGAEFQVDIAVNSALNLFGAGFELNYTNANYIDVINNSAQPGTFLGNDVVFFVPNVDDAAGKVSIGITRKTGQPGVSGSGVVAQIKFKSLAATPPGTQVVFSLKNIAANDPNGNSIVLTPEEVTVTLSSGGSFVVWPGDNNNDKKVDQNDVLPLGLHWNKTGPARQNASSNWIGQLAMSWTPENATHADANGDGKVDQNDVLPIGLNWSKMHSAPPLVISNTNALSHHNETRAPYLKTVVIGDTNPGQDFWIDIVADSTADLFGISYELLYSPTTYVDPQTVEAGSLMGTDVILFPMIDKSMGMISVGITRKSGQGGVNGSGVIARIKMRMSGNAAIGRNTTLTLQNVAANDPAGNPIQFTALNNSIITSITADRDGELPISFALYGNFPNPFNPSTRISYALPEASEIKLEIFDMMGKHVRTLVNENQQAGRYSAVWDGRDERGQVVASGMFIYRLSAGRFVQSRKMIFVR